MNAEDVSMKPLQIGGLTAQVPIVLGGMGVGISLSRLAGAVAAQGGVGVISAAVPGYNHENFLANPLKANLEALAFHIQHARRAAKTEDTSSNASILSKPDSVSCETKKHARRAAKTEDTSSSARILSKPDSVSLHTKETNAGGLVGVNIMCAINNYADYVKCCEDNGADIIISGAGLPSELPALAQNTRIAPIVSSKKAVAVLLKLWDKKFSRTADMVVIEGPKAGGHLGFSPAQLENECNYEDEIKLILQEVSLYEEKFGRKIPVIFGGGIYSHEDVMRYISLGLAGVQVSTRFVATEECDAADAYKNAYVAAKKEDIVIIKSPVGMPGRALNNAFVQGIETRPPQQIRCINCLAHCNPQTTPYCISRALINAAKGDTENGLIFCGANADKIKEISTVKKVMDELLGR